jgi:DegV family protein with EDD domain
MPRPAALRELGGRSLGDALRGGIHRLFEHTDHLNRINVFPVADGDTGTNMSMTLAAVLAALDRAPEDHAGRLLLCAADAALDGARGNSGAILAQFLQGAADRGGDFERLRVSDFADAIEAGSSQARDSLCEPREGTLLTVLAAFARELRRVSNAGIEDFRELFATAMVRVREALVATREQLPELRAAGVVDAGAAGLVEMLEGIRHYFDTGETGRAAAPVHGNDDDTAGAPLGNGAAGAAAAAPERYCTECLVSAAEAQLDLRRLRERMSALGSSLVVSGSTRKARIHLHTAAPEVAFEAAAQFGAVSAQKADDMWRQQAAAQHARVRRVAVVTDSAADIAEDALESLDIHVVPLRVHFGNQSWLDKVSLSPEQFYAELARNPEHPKTSQPPPGDFRRLFEFLVSHYESVVCVSVTARVSGTHAAATGAAQRVGTALRPVVVVDSGTASLGQGLVALAAARCAQAGGSLQDVVAAATAARQRTFTFGLLENLDAAVRGGRVPPLARRLSRLLNLSPLLASFPDGRITLAGALWGRHRLVARFAAHVRAVARKHERQELAATWQVCVGHGNAAAAAATLANELTREFAGALHAPVGIVPLGTALGVHGGAGMLVVGIERCLQSSEESVTPVRFDTSGR